MRRSASVLLSTVGVTLLAACGSGDGDPSSGRATSETPTAQEPTAEGTTAPADDATDDEPPFPEGTARQTARNHGDGDLVLTNVRVAEHNGFDRIVLEFSGTGTPGWTVNYVDEAVLDGSGRVVTLDGDSTLDIYASGTTYPGPDDEDYYGGPRRLDAAPDGITEVYVVGTFEGDTQVLAGIDGDRVPFRVFALTNPSRLVVDVRR